MSRRIVTLLAVIAASTAAGTGRAQSLDTTISVRSGTRFELSNIQGNITIQASRRQEIRIRADYDRARVEIDESPGSVTVRTIARRRDADVDYTVSVPVHTYLEVRSVSSDMDVSGVCGAADLQSVSGEITLTCGEGAVTAQSVSGDVSVSDVTGRLEVGSTSGRVIVRNVRATVAAHSVSGDIDIEQVDGDQVSAETVSGEIIFGGRIRDDGRYEFQAHSGDVTVRTNARNLNATVSVSTFSGNLETDFPVTISPGGRIGAREFQFTLGSGSARMRLASFSGTIYLRRAGGAAPKREDR